MTAIVLVAARHAQECAGEIQPAIQWPKLRCPNGGILGGSRGLNWRSRSLGRELFDPPWRFIPLAQPDTNRGNETWRHIAFAIVLNMRRIRLHRLFNRSRSSGVISRSSRKMAAMSRLCQYQPCAQDTEVQPLVLVPCLVCTRSYTFQSTDATHTRKPFFGAVDSRRLLSLLVPSLLIGSPLRT
jgi:hypothetical protein